MRVLWYYTSGGRQMEPVEAEEIRRLARDGRLKPTDMVWHEGMAKWTRAGAVAELFPDPDALFERALAAPPAPTPAAPAAPAAVLPPAAAAPAAATLPPPIPASQLVEPILLEVDPIGGPAPRSASAWPEVPEPVDDRPGRPRRRKRRRDQTTTLVVLIAIALGGGLLLVVLVLGLFFIAIH